LLGGKAIINFYRQAICRTGHTAERQQTAGSVFRRKCPCSRTV